MNGNDKIVPIAFLVVSIGIFVATVYHFYGDQLIVPPDTADAPAVQDFDYTATGTITFSAAHPEQSTQGVNVMGSYQINATDPTAGYQALFPFSGINNMYFTTADLDQGFMIYGDEGRSDDLELQFGVAAFTVVDPDDPVFNVELLNAEGWYERQLAYSAEQQQLLYVTQQNEVFELELFQNLRNWQINLVSVDDPERQIVTNGIHPVWYRDTNSFFYIQQDGIYFYNLEEDQSYQVAGVHEQLLERTDLEQYNLNNSLTITPDGSMLLLTSPAENAIYFYQVTIADEEVKVEQTGVYQEDIGVGHYSVVVSPDSRYFAALQTTYAPPRFEQLESLQIVIGSIHDQVILHSIDVSDFAFETFFIDGWQ